MQDDSGTIYRADINACGRKLSVYTAHLDWHYYSCYNARGYDGETWKETGRIADADEVLHIGAASRRVEQIETFIKDARNQIREGYAVLLGGDFNEPSCLDWIGATAGMFDHNGLTVEWPATKLLLDNGFVDLWRAIYPDPVRNPGITYPSDVPSLPVEKVCWAPKADDRDRIDYLYASSAVMPVEAELIGPRTSMCRAQRVYDDSADRIVVPLGIWFSDHKGLLVKFLVSDVGK